MLSTEMRVRKKLRDDLAAYSKACLRIRTKNAQIVPLVFNKAQIKLHDAAEQQRKETGRVRIITVKGRQQGISTYVNARGFHKTTHRNGWRSFILAHEQAGTNNLFEMVDRFYKNLPEMVRPSINASNATELDFGLLDSGYRVATAGTKGAGRGSTIQFFHGSEVGYWPMAETHAAGVLQAVPDVPESEIWFESTGNGIGTFFHKQWQLAEAGQSDFKAVFIPWFIQDEYRRKVPDGFVLDDPEHEYMETYGLTLEQMAWKRAKTVELHNDPALFAQEYPATSREAFQAGEHDVFIPVSVVERAMNTNHDPVGPKVMGVDVARFGDDRSAIIIRQGRKVILIKTFEKLDTMALTGRVKVLCDEHKPDAVFVDAIGVGAGVIDRLKEMGVAHVHQAQAGERALNDDLFVNRRSEMWSQIKDWLIEGADLPRNDELASDLTGLKYKYDSRGRLLMEKKDDAKARGVRSPDLADALALTFYRPVVAQKLKMNVPAMAGGWMR